MKAMILAAGFGTRLFPLTIDRTKPAIPFLGKPLVGYVAEYVAKFGFKEVVVNLHHQPESVKQALGDGQNFGVHIDYTLESPTILGTSGALDNAKELLKDDTFLIVNGKIITDIDIAAALKTHKESGAIATMVLKENAKFEKFTEVFVQNGEVKGFASGFPIENPKSHLSVPLMFTGIHILEPKVFEYIPENVYSDIVPTFYLPAIANGEKIAAHICNNRWFELSTIPRYLDISLEMMNGEKVCQGENCNIDKTATVINSVIWDNVTIEANAKVNRVIIADGVTIKANNEFENVAIVQAEMVKNCDEIPEKALKGEYIGENYVVPLNQ
ncbi:MAG: NDP-sugar synthase [Pyrinomonadaceae bacterium]|jgi:NDP-sugar pyrophosphorylase family protein|nr:NDP-sugar synthase [Pyrinomonadaceae bacterium]